MRSPNASAIISYFVLVLMGVLVHVFDRLFANTFSSIEECMGSGWLSRVLRWKYTSVFGVGIWFLGVNAMLTDKYGFAYFCFLVGGLWLIGWWLTVHPAPRRVEHKRLTEKQKQQMFKRWGGVLILLTLTAAMFLYTTTLKSAHDVELLTARLNLRSDWLVPANDPMPDTSCKGKVPSDSLMIMFGNLTSWSQKFPHTLIEVSGIPKFTIDRNEKGAIAVTTDVMDDNNDAVVEIDKNRFTVSNDAFIDRKDLSTLSVTVRHNKQQVLYVRYLNPQVLKVRGIFKYGDVSIRATDTDVEVPGFFKDSGCSGGTEVDYAFGR